jgi:hypothetical protein
MKQKRLTSKNRISTPASETTIAVNYSPAARVLEVVFTGGQTYHYLHVEPEVWEDYKSTIKKGGSSGVFVNTRIKPFYDDVKIS